MICIGTVLGINKTLVELDLSDNRLFGLSPSSINSNLETFYPESVNELTKAIHENGVINGNLSSINIFDNKFASCSCYEDLEPTENRGNCLGCVQYDVITR
jgi:hypothetical protein